MAPVIDNPSTKLQPDEPGLTQTEAARRLTQFGPNEPATPRRTANLLQLFILFTNPLAIILIIASVISAALGEVIAICALTNWHARCTVRI